MTLLVISQTQSESKDNVLSDLQQSCNFR